MPRLEFSARGIAGLKPRKTRVDYWSDDPAEAGFGIRVQPTGVKTWFLYTRDTSLSVQAARRMLGRFPEMGLADAREAARQERAKLRLGRDTVAEQRKERAIKRETVKALFRAYEAHVLLRRQAGEFRSWGDVRRSLERDVLPAWGDRRARDIRRKDVIELVTQKALKGRTAANRLQAHIGMLFSFGVAHDWIDSNPAAGLKKSAERPRDRVLTADELRTLWLYLDGDQPLTLTRGGTEGPAISMPAATAATLRDVFKVLILCGQRLGETSRALWADVDLPARIWTLPATITKNRTEHRVPLSRQAAALLEARRTADPASPYVFPSRPGSQKPALVWAKRTAKPIAAAVGVVFTAHDLRRTVATQMGELGITDDVIGLVLNHRKPGVTARHYDLATRETSKRDALERWANRLDAIVTKRPARVTAIGARRGRGR